MSNSMKTAFPVFNGYAPKDAPKALPIPFDFSTVDSFEFDLLNENTQGIIGFVQSVYVDNYDNPNPLEIYVFGTQQRVVIPAGATGIWPIFSIDQVKMRVSSANDPAAIGSIILLNVPMPLTQWGPIDVTANITAETITQVSAANFSDVIALGGTSQSAIGANANRKGFLIQNPATEIESLYIDFGIAAAPGSAIELPPGAMFPPNGSPYVTAQQINVYAATTGHAYIAKEFA